MTAAISHCEPGRPAKEAVVRTEVTITAITITEVAEAGTPAKILLTVVLMLHGQTGS